MDALSHALPRLAPPPVRICPRCRGAWHDEARACPDDGAHLLRVFDQDPRCGTVVADRFLLLEPLGRGGMGLVYRAWQLSAERPVALKLLPETHARHETAVQRFLREARVTASLRSPHTVTVYDFGQLPSGELYLAMELLEGRTLEQLVAEEGRLAPERAVRLALQICLSLEEAHGKGLVHRDLKPANVMVERQGDHEYAKVLDFGIVKVLDGAATTLTAAGSPGTPHYMSPEQAQGEDVGPETDVYAVALLLFEMLTGSRPFPGDSGVRALVDHADTPPPHLTDVAPDIEGVQALDALLQRCLAKSRAERPTGVTTLRHALEGLDVGKAPGWTAQPRQVTTRPRAPAAPEKRRVELKLQGFGCAIQLAVAFGALLAVGLPLLLSDRAPDPPASLAPAPAYHVEGPFGGQKRVRSEAADAGGPFLPYSVVRLHGRPTVAQPAPLPVALYVARDDGPLRRLPEALVERAPGGAWRLEAEGSAVFGEPGQYTLYAVVGDRSPWPLAGLPPALARLLAGGAAWHHRPATYRLDPL